MIIFDNIYFFVIIFIGSRNLNAKKKSREKVIEVEEPEEIVNVRDNEEEVQEDVNDEMIL